MRTDLRRLQTSIEKMLRYGGAGNPAGAAQATAEFGTQLLQALQQLDVRIAALEEEKE